MWQWNAELRRIYCSNIWQIVSKSYQHFKSRKKQIKLLNWCVKWNEKTNGKQNKKTKKQRETKQKDKIQDVVEVVSSNTFASTQQVSEDNLKEFLVPILHLCIFTNQIIVSVIVHVSTKHEKDRIHNKFTKFSLQHQIHLCLCEVHIVQQFHKLNKQTKQISQLLKSVNSTKQKYHIRLWNEMKIETIHKPTIPNVQTSDFLL
jgi:endonuclease/exonuclease/phosphatase (EEP) superfamily protein YafD